MGNLRDDIVTIVSGLPRSGTSMMMNMLRAGGLEPVADGLREADDDNPRGYFEFEPAKKIAEDTSWLPRCRGKVFKIVSLLLRHLPPGHAYKVIFMERNLEEVLSSQEKMLARMGKTEGQPSREQMRAIYEKHLAGIKAWLGGRPDIEVLYVRFDMVIENPAARAKEINAFMGGGLDERAMALVVEEALYRNRAAS